MEDARIVELFLSRDEAAIRASADKYGARLRALAQGIVADAQTAEECENDTYLQAWASIPPHAPKDYLYAFLARITRHLALNCCRNRKRLKRNAYLCELTAEMEACIPAPDEVPCRLDDGELAQALNLFLASLDHEKRSVFVRRYWYLDSIADISERFKISRSKAKTMLHRMRAQLKEHLGKEGYVL